MYPGVELESCSPCARRFRARRRQELGIAETDVVFLYVGDLRKGARQCIQALSRLAAGHLVLVSRSSPEPYRALAHEAGVSSRVHLLPPTNRVQELYGV